MSEEAATGRYVYCIIRGEGPRDYETRGLGGDSGRVYTVGSDGLSAVVSDSATVEYERSRRNMITHSLVQEEVIRDRAILPVRFGTVAPDVDSIREKLLSRRYGEFLSLLAEVEGRVELGLKVFWQEHAPFREIAEGDAEIRRLGDSLARRSPEETYYERIRLGEMVAAQLARKRDEAAEAIIARLRPLAYKSKANANLGERMVLNAAFLVDRRDEERFDEAVRTLGVETQQRLAFKYVGPVPPYNFVNIIVTWDG